jgi:putative hydrolase
VLRALHAAIASRFDEVALLLDQQQANPFRVAAYRRAAGVLRRLDRPVSQILETEGLEGLVRLPGIGESLARSIHAVIVTGRLPMLDRLRGQSDPISLLMSVPGIGRKLADRLHDELGIDSLEELETAAYDGRLRTIAGVGEKTLAGIRDVLATRLARAREPGAPAGAAPSVGELLDVDREYRRKAQTGELRKIAPRRLNPTGAAWLPVLHTRRGEREYTALFSNTPRAHRLGRTRDWVVLYSDGGCGEQQYTVVTEWQGPLDGLRTVRGREEECRQHYATRGKNP